MRFPDCANSSKKRSRNRRFSEAELNYFYALLDEPLTPYDCGRLCAPKNGGEPFCCSVDNAVPMLYREEFRYLSRRTELWRRWKPKTATDKKMKKEDETRILIFCECKGVKHCERHNRSIGCRTFPLEPYFNEKGEFVGLIFMKEFCNKCPLIHRLDDIQQSVIDKHYRFWQIMLALKPDELELYKSTSRGWRISAKKRGVPLPVLYPSKNARAGTD
ncbi:MAG: hypothetical protein N2Z22_00320 [Turneriella sp.]|nr:hypothetical protein [Turneriella sp.]